MSIESDVRKRLAAALAVWLSDEQWDRLLDDVFSPRGKVAKTPFSEEDERER